MRFVPGDRYHPRYQHVYILARGANIFSPLANLAEPLPENQLDLPKTLLEKAHYIGDWHRNSTTFHCMVVQAGDFEAPIEGEWLLLRSLLGKIDESHFQMLGRALQITRWAREHQFCGVCGELTEARAGERAMSCQSCESIFYPRISPCVICLVTRGKDLLLARHNRKAADFFSTLAGFIEPGENAEQAVIREIREEVAIEIENLRYIRSQAWPFPGQLMLGYLAEYKSGDLQPDGEEILEAAWFSPNNLPQVPPPSTISGQLIAHHLSSIGKSIK